VFQQDCAECRVKALAVIAPKKEQPLPPPPSFPANINDGRRAVPFSELSPSGCKWAVTPHNAAPSHHRFCNAPRSAEVPYCAQHARKACAAPAQNLEGLAA
jgi:hypothetical protein